MKWTEEHLLFNGWSGNFQGYINTEKKKHQSKKKFQSFLDENIRKISFNFEGKSETEKWLYHDAKNMREREKERETVVKKIKNEDKVAGKLWRY